MLYDQFMRNKFHAISHGTDVIDEASGYPCVFETTKSKPLKSCVVTADSFQDGTPTPDAPIPIQHTSVLVTDTADEHYGEYKTVVKQTCGDYTQSYSIYTTEPLRKGDTLDLVSGKGIRNTEQYTFKGNEVCTLNSTVPVDAAYRVFSIKINSNIKIKKGNILCTHFKYIDSDFVMTTARNSVSCPSTAGYYLFFKTNTSTTADGFLFFLNQQFTLGNPVTVNYTVYTPVPFTFTSVPITAQKGTSIITTDSDVPATDITAKYVK